ncbi:hypothetical protein, unlikely [Trypanosoma brucei brucei TREU927]|uniref:Uncharacterized protein n=1 Tax=Trypanosoma brucei brucei (strain 927/4 GUTat10.1) TaxID=185431 RepID=Q4GY51_TRYB2|nr:hypothetical protein, unlikely [Trypanosoma brucei brucei TREU927]CAJ16738.1 hypothetical protein, unlikely [Trypanosoma brucei brucei TREU927]
MKLRTYHLHHFRLFSFPLLTFLFLNVSLANFHCIPFIVLSASILASYWAATTTLIIYSYIYTLTTHSSIIIIITIANFNKTNKTNIIRNFKNSSYFSHPVIPLLYTHSPLLCIL